MTPSFTVSSAEYKVWKFPSGEIGVKLLSKPDVPSLEVIIKGSMLSSDSLIELLQLVDSLRAAGCTTLSLVMPYCAYSRQDRVCNKGESFSLKVFTDLINSCSFDSVTTWDNHSDVATALINNCRNTNVADIVSYDVLEVDNYDYLVSPDAGANKKVFECSKTLGIPMIRADKVRDTVTGAITETVVLATKEQLKDSTVLVVDDICQGGRTFEELAKALKEIEPSCTIHLYVTHGFFSSPRGLDNLKEAGISHFITTNSVTNITDTNLTIIER